jgi:hypothetical protein
MQICIPYSEIEAIVADVERELKPIRKPNSKRSSHPSEADVITRVSNDMPPEVEKRLMDIGYLEVAFGTGEVDMVECIRALKQINYQGKIYPEHFPSLAGDRAAGVAWTIGYIRALDETVEP